MTEPLWVSVSQSPVCSIIVASCVGIWLTAKNYNLNYEHLGFSVQTCWNNGEYWRVFSASMTHIDLLHLAFNMSSLWSLRFLETLYGPVWYLRVSFFLLVLSVAMTLVVYKYVLPRMGFESSLQTFSVGYSCVVFGLMTLAHQITGRSKVSFLGFSIPLSLMPFGALLLTQLLVPNASLTGHLSGIVLGYLMSWGLLRLLDTSVFFAALFWSAVVVVLSLKMTTALPMRWLQLSAPGEDLREVRIENGVIRTVAPSGH
eukprot:m51a1_g13250 hypothetical protein (258) ;mRNA; f:294-1719